MLRFAAVLMLLFGLCGDAALAQTPRFLGNSHPSLYPKFYKNYNSNGTHSQISFQCYVKNYDQIFTCSNVKVRCRFQSGGNWYTQDSFEESIGPGDTEWFSMTFSTDVGRVASTIEFYIMLWDGCQWETQESEINAYMSFDTLSGVPEDYTVSTQTDGNFADITYPNSVTIHVSFYSAVTDDEPGYTWRVYLDVMKLDGSGNPYNEDPEAADEGDWVNVAFIGVDDSREDYNTIIAPSISGTIGYANATTSSTCWIRLRLVGITGGVPTTYSTYYDAIPPMDNDP